MLLNLQMLLNQGYSNMENIIKPTSKETELDKFKAFFAGIKRKLKLESYMCDILWKHMVAYKFDSSDKFVEGIKHYGLKLDK